MIRHHMISNIMTTVMIMVMIMDEAHTLNLCMHLLETLVAELMENYDLINK